jgi:hypothetical protein
VTEIAMRQVHLINAFQAVQEQQGKLKPGTNDYEVTGDRIDMLTDRMVSNRDAASYLTPRTAEGAAFILLSMHTDVANMQKEQSASMKEFYFRRFERSAWAMRRYISRELGVCFYMHWGRHYMGGFDPVELVTAEMTFARKTED